MSNENYGRKLQKEGIEWVLYVIPAKAGIHFKWIPDYPKGLLR